MALGIVVDNLAMFTFGKEPRSLPSPLAQTPLNLGDVGLGLYPLQVLIPVVGLALAAVLHLLSRRTRWGTGMLAVVQNPSAARLPRMDWRACMRPGSTTSVWWISATPRHAPGCRLHCIKIAPARPGERG